MASIKRGYRIIAVIIVCILIVSGVGGYLYYRGLAARRNVIGIIDVEGAILSSEDANICLEAINQAITNNTVKAVVLRVNSPGGYADLVEQIYLDLLELRRVKPVVASVTLALSGGYYIAVAADYIYVEPTSFIGNIGVIGVMPPTLIPSETVLETGVYKATGFSKLLFPFNLTRALDSFISAVKAGRGERLKISPMELRRGMIYMGSEALSIGLVDGIGSLQKAISKAAEEAGIVEYEVVNLSKAVGGSSVLGSYSQNYTLEWRGLTIEALNRFHPPPSTWYIYLPPNASTYSIGQANGGINVPGGGKAGLVVVDKSHGNKISAWELDILIAELAKRNVTVSFISDWSRLMLNSTSCLIIASPTTPYSMEECDEIEGFVGRGGLLLLFFDPAYEYLDTSKLSGPINSISNRFGLSFAKGYLYNEGEHYGFYRNIYVREFKDNPITRNLTSLVLFTATHIHSMGKGVAWTSSNTYSSVAERAGNYTVIAVVERNGTVIAFGDQTFLMEPYCYVEDNYKLILNIVSEILRVKVAVREEAREIVKPNLPVGTVKEFTESVNGEEHPLKWVKVSEREIVTERPDRITRYYYDEKESLVKYTSNGIEVIYDTPIPAPPYPLTKGESWSYRSSYTLHINNRETRGEYVEECYVESLQDVEAGNGKTYFCAKISYRTIDRFNMDGGEITIATKGSLWISSEAGHVKEECLIQYYVNGVLTQEMNVKILLKSIQKG